MLAGVKMDAVNRTGANEFTGVKKMATGFSRDICNCSDFSAPPANISLNWPTSKMEGGAISNTCGA
jgi:hypothetical protein